MTKTNRLILVGLLATTSVGALAPAAMAQEATAEEGEQARKLAPVTVTARKSEESLIDVPLAVTAITAAELEARDIEDISDIAAYTPGFSNQSQSVGRNDRGFKQFVIRGLIPNSGLASRAAATMFVDGAPVGGGNISGISDIERVEVVKGPQSAFFGRATFAGAINLVTRTPSFRYQGKASVDYSSFNTIDTSATVEGPLIEDKVAFRLNGRFYSTDGHYSNYGNPGDRLGARSTRSVSATLYAEPTPNWTARLFGTVFRDSDGSAANGQFGSGQHNCNTGVVDYFCGELGTVPRASIRREDDIRPFAYDLLRNGVAFHGGDFIDHLGLEREAAQLRFLTDYEFENGYRLSGIAAYSDNKWAFLQTPAHFDPTAFPRPDSIFGDEYTLVLGNTRDEDLTFEVRLASPEDQRLRWMLGVNYIDAETNNLTPGVISAGYRVLSQHTVNANETLGYFGSVSYDITDKLTLSAEGRYQIDDVYQQTLAGDFPEYSETYESFTPRIIASYKPTDNTTLYASYAEGRRPGEFNTRYFAYSPEIQAQLSSLTQVFPAVPEDEITMYEVGFKGTALDNRARFSLAAYVGEWTNRHIPQYLYYTNELGDRVDVQLTAPDGVVDLQGIEFEGAFQATDAIRFEGTYNIASTEIKNTICVECATLTGDLSPEGTTLPYYPEYSGTFSTIYERPVWNGQYDGYIRMDYIYTGRQYATEANLAWIGDRHDLNLRVGVDTGKYRIEVYGTNLLDDDTPISLARTNEARTNLQAITVSLPDRPTVGIRGSVNF